MDEHDHFDLAWHIIHQRMQQWMTVILVWRIFNETE